VQQAARFTGVEHVGPPSKRDGESVVGDAGCRERAVTPGHRPLRRRKAAAVARPPARTAISNVIGTNASVELSGFPPTFNDQSNTAA